MIPASSQRPGAALGLCAPCPGLTGPHILEIPSWSLVHLFPSLHPWVCPLGQVFLDFCNSHIKGVLAFHFGALHPPLWSEELSKLPSLSSWVKPFCGPTDRSVSSLEGPGKTARMSSSSRGASYQASLSLASISCFTLPVLYQPHHAVLSAWTCSSPPCDPGQLSLTPVLLLTVPPPGSLRGPFLSPTATSVPLRYSDPYSILAHSPLYYILFKTVWCAPFLKSVYWTCYTIGSVLHFVIWPQGT